MELAYSLKNVRRDCQQPQQQESPVNRQYHPGMESTEIAENLMKTTTPCILTFKPTLMLLT